MAVQKTREAWMEAGQQLGLSFKRAAPPTRLWDPLTLEGTLEEYEITIFTTITTEEGVGGGVIRRKTNVRLGVPGLPPGLVVRFSRITVGRPSGGDRYVVKADAHDTAVGWLSPARREALRQFPSFDRVKNGTIRVSRVGLLKTSEEIVSLARAAVALARTLDVGR